MAARKTLDRQPGAVPEVLHDGDSVLFLLEVAGAPERIKLVLRCTQHGEILASVANLPDSPKA
jgi:hypothetical protein